MRWLITGGCGFIGTNLVGALESEGGHAIRIIDNLSVGSREDLRSICRFRELPPAGLPPIGCGGVELVVGDILDASLARAAAEDAEIFVHLAANTGVASSVADPISDCRCNVFGTLSCLEAARHAGVRRFVFASSGAAIGETAPPIHEELAPHPVSPYGASKLAGEGYCSAFCHSFGLETVALRFGNVYGPGSGHKSSVVAQFVDRAIVGLPLEIYGDGRQTRDFIAVSDLIRAVRLAAVTPGVGGEIFQIATAAETSVRELVEFLVPLFRRAGLDDITVVHRKRRQGDVARNFSDTAKALRMLGWKAEIDLARGLWLTIDWFLARRRASA